MSNITVLSLSTGCPLDFDYNIRLDEVLIVQVAGQLAILPGAVFSALAIDKLGRVKVIGKSENKNSTNALHLKLMVKIQIET
jgi:ABC-type enterobactin transport system permease subunit